MQTFFLLLFAFSSGIAVAAGTFAFLAAIGIIPRMAKRTKTQQHIRVYEDMTVLGGLFGTTAMYIDYRLPASDLLITGFVTLNGIFVGILAMALTEVLNVMPILMRRTRLTKGLPWLILIFSLGKVAGSMIYFLVDGFYIL